MGKRSSKAHSSFNKQRIALHPSSPQTLHGAQELGLHETRLQGTSNVTDATVRPARRSETGGGAPRAAGALWGGSAPPERNRRAPPRRGQAGAGPAGQGRAARPRSCVLPAARAPSSAAPPPPSPRPPAPPPARLASRSPHRPRSGSWRISAAATSSAPRRGRPWSACWGRGGRLGAAAAAAAAGGHGPPLAQTPRGAGTAAARCGGGRGAKPCRARLPPGVSAGGPPPPCLGAGAGGERSASGVPAPSRPAPGGGGGPGPPRRAARAPQPRAPTGLLRLRPRVRPPPRRCLRK